MAEDNTDYGYIAQQRKDRLRVFLNNVSSKVTQFNYTPQSASELRSQTEYMVDALVWVRDEADMLISRIRLLGQ